MNKNLLLPIFVSAVTGAILTLGITAFFSNIYNPSPTSKTDGTPQMQMPSAAPTFPAASLTPQISASDITNLTLETRSKTFCREDLEYRQITEMVRPDNFSLAECESLEISFSADKSAVKTVSSIYYDEKLKRTSFKKMFVFKAKLTSGQYSNLTKTIAEDEIFRRWDDRVDIDQSDSIFSVKHNSGEKRILSNIEDPARSFILLIKPLKVIARELKWTLTVK